MNFCRLTAVIEKSSWLRYAVFPHKKDGDRGRAPRARGCGKPEVAVQHDTHHVRTEYVTRRKRRPTKRQYYGPEWTGTGNAVGRIWPHNDTRIEGGQG